METKRAHFGSSSLVFYKFGHFQYPNDPNMDIKLQWFVVQEIFHPTVRNIVSKFEPFKAEKLDIQII